MKIYAFGNPDAPKILLLPGTCCHWKSNFGAVIPLLEGEFRVLCASYDGFDETESATFPGMIEETEKLEDYIRNECGGHIRAAYGCSLGGSFVGLLIVRQRIHIDFGILGSSDLDQAPKWIAKLETKLAIPMVYPIVRDGAAKSKMFRKRMDSEYVRAFMNLFGGARPYVSKKSCETQFYSDLITPLPEKISVPGTEVHIFYALQMGKKYRARYEKHFAHPTIHEQNLRHEELLACHPQQWAQLVKSIAQ